jgi:nitronate monooxygenase
VIPVTSLADICAKPIFVAPMAGGPSTPALVVAAAEGGALGFLAGGYKPVEQVEDEIAEVRRLTAAPFGVNVFVPGRPTTNTAAVADYTRELAADAARLGVDLGDPRWDDDSWHQKVELLIDTAPTVCSFTFGCPNQGIIDALHARGTMVVVTATNPDDAVVAARAGADMLCAQGIEAGAHRGTFADDAHDEELALVELVARVRARVDVAIIAAGGLSEPSDVRRVMQAGATAVQVGTAFLRSDESAASALHKAALVDPRFTTTAMTRAFTGRRARGLRNGFMLEHPDAPAAYPEIHHVTRPLRAAAVRLGDAQATSLWAGTGHRRARTGPARDIIDWLASEVD